MASRLEKGCLVLVTTILLLVTSIVLYMYLALRADSEEYVYSRESVKTEVGDIDVSLQGTWRYPGKHLSVLGNPYELFISLHPSEPNVNSGKIESISFSDAQTGEIYFESGQKPLKLLSATGDKFYIQFWGLTLPPTNLSVRIRISLEKQKERKTVDTFMTLEFRYIKENYNTLWAAMMGI